jgi:hypothetical protein
MKTDNQTQIGLHVFERANLGKAPFRCIGSDVRTYQATPDSPVQPGTCCDYCGTGIIYVAIIRGADGREFKTGFDCVQKTGDAGLIKGYKNRPEVRKIARERRAALDTRKQGEWAAILADEANRAKLAAHMVPTWNNGTEPWLAMAERVYPKCGASGRTRYLRAAKQLLAQ